MSAKGLHLKKLGRFKNTFESNKHERYIYASCNLETADYYNEVDKWEFICEYKATAFYRKRLPKEAICIKRHNLQKKAMKEKLWLCEKLKDGMVLFGKVGDEYIFERSVNADKTEYYVDYISENKNIDEYLYQKALGGFECVSPSTDGITYYFIKREGHEVVRGLKKLRTEKTVKKREMLWAFLGFTVITAVFITVLFFALKYRTAVIQCLVIGGVMSLVSFIVFIILKKRYNREKTRIEEETEIYGNEERYFKPEEKNVLLKNATLYDGDEWQYVDEDDVTEDDEFEKQDFFHSKDEIKDSTKVSENDAFQDTYVKEKRKNAKISKHAVYQIVSMVFFMTEYVVATVLSVINIINWFTPGKRGVPFLLFIAVTVILFSPAVIFNGISAIADTIKDIKCKNNKTGRKNF